MSLINAEPILQIIESCKKLKPESDIREWIPVIGHITDVFYVKRQIGIAQIESLKRDTLNLEKSFQTLSINQRDRSAITPRLLNRYLWMHDYFTIQNYQPDQGMKIRDRILEIDRNLFTEFFKRIAKK